MPSARARALAVALAPLWSSGVAAQDDALERNAALGWSELHAALDVNQRERGLRRLILAGTPGLRELERASRSDDAELQRLALRGLAWLEPDRSSDLWIAASSSPARRVRREAALRLAHDATEEGEAALRARTSDLFDDVCARACFALLARGAAAPFGAPPPSNAGEPPRRAWIDSLPWTGGEGLQSIGTLADPALQAELFRRVAREGPPADDLDVEVLFRAIGGGEGARYDRRAALSIVMQGSPKGVDADLFAANFEAEEGADALGSLDRALLLRCLHAGARISRAQERLRRATRDRVDWLLPAWPWILDREQRRLVLEQSLHEPIGEELVLLLHSDPELEQWSGEDFLELFRRARRSGLRQPILRAAARSPQHFEGVLAAALTDPEALVRERAAQIAIERGRLEEAIDAALREISPLVQVRLATSLAKELERRGEGERAARLALTWARCAEPAPRRLALHLLLTMDPTESALAAALELWRRTPAADGERSGVHGLVARFDGARAESIEGLREIGESDERTARERVGHLEPEMLLGDLEGEAELALAVRGELAWRRALAGLPEGAAFLRERFDRLPEDLALRALDALASFPTEENWELFERLRSEDRLDADVLLESAAPMLELEEVAGELRGALESRGAPRMRQAALRGLGRATDRGQSWLRRAIEPEVDAPGVFSSGDLIAWIEALDRSEASASCIARVLVSRCASGLLLADRIIRPEMTRALRWLGNAGSIADRALLAEMRASGSTGRWASVPTAALVALIAATAEELPASARFLSRWASATAEPDAELCYFAEPVLARAAAAQRDLEGLRRHLALWLAAWNELEIRGLLAARDLAPLELLGSPQPELQARVLLALLDVERSLERGDAPAARAYFARASAAAFFDVGARVLVCAYGSSSAELAVAARAEAERWSALGAESPPAVLHGPLRGIEQCFLVRR